MIYEHIERSSPYPSNSAPLKLVNLIHWNQLLPQLKESYKNASPFPHLVLDHFFPEEMLTAVYEHFPSKEETKKWTHYQHYNESKMGLTYLDQIPSPAKDLIRELCSPAFVHFLEELTGIKNLISDLSLEGGGLHQTEKGGHLNIHSDFTVHGHHSNWTRRVNFLIYLNKNWKEDYGGHLELWDKKMTRCYQKISPLFNRAVVFTTDRSSLHGHPHPLTCPDGESRKSIALYYFTETPKDKINIQATTYYATPNDGMKKIFIKADNFLIFLYHRFKMTFGINDIVASKILKLVSFFSQKK